MNLIAIIIIVEAQTDHLWSVGVFSNWLLSPSEMTSVSLIASLASV